MSHAIARAIAAPVLFTAVLGLVRLIGALS